MTRTLHRSAVLALLLLAGGVRVAFAQDTTGVARDTVRPQKPDTAAASAGDFITLRAESAVQAGTWDSPRALALVAEARRRRAMPRGDTGLVNYQSRAYGFVYFFLDRNAAPDKTLVKVDQLALNVFWQAPNQTKQQIIGMRDVSRLPNRMYYHLDHLTVQQNEFSDIIQLGEGDEVRTVLHPAAPGAEQSYQYRVADSLTLTLQGSPTPVRVYELAVRPRHVNQPGFIGSLYVDQRSGAIVRMTFTFTRASYVDRRLDYINVSLENALFENRYWLPHEQRLEIRRQVPELDFPAGAVIRGVFRVGDYRFNQPLPPSLFAGYPVEARPEAERKSFSFPEGIYADLNQEGLAPPPDMATLRAQAAQLVRQKYLSGLPKLRLHLGGASSVLRYDRAEGIHVGGGFSWSPAGTINLSALAGYATATQRPDALGQIRVAFADGSTLRLDGFVHGLQDIGLRPAVPGALNTLSSAFLGTDYLDPYYASGGFLEGTTPLGGWTGSLRLTAELDQSGGLADSTPIFRPSAIFRPVRPIDEDPMVSARVGLGHAVDESGDLGWGGRLEVEGGMVGNRSFYRPALLAQLLARSRDHKTALRFNAEGGVVFGTVPAQRLFLIGGPGTLPGYDIRAFAGDRYGLATLDLTRDVFAPFVRLRLTGAAGWTDFHASSSPIGWDATTTDGVKTSVGAGVGLGWDIIRLDVARGLNAGGRWQLVFSVHPELWDML